MKERVLGVVIIFIGCLLGYFCIYEPLEAAKSGDPSVSVSLKGAILAPMGLIGVLYLVMGERVNKLMGTREKPTSAAYAIGLGAVAIGFGLYFWLRTTLESHGYDFQGKF